jgi:5-methylcytosine-specific restriction endonuclease McrA
MATLCWKMSIKKEHIFIERVECKTCCKCNITKGLIAFYRQKGRWDSLSPRCKDCAKINDRITYLKVRNVKIERQKQKYRTSDIIKRSIYSNACYIKRKESFKKRAQDLKRRVLKKHADKTYKITALVIQQLLDKYSRICVYCSKELQDFSVDHIIPLARGGDNSFENLAISCRSCNSSKGKKLLSEWRAE